MTGAFFLLSEGETPSVVYGNALRPSGAKSALSQKRDKSEQI
jgi:hypothetical protein